MTLHELIRQPELQVFKDDRKSRVWLVDDLLGQRWVIKRWRHARWRQGALWLLGQHPAQREARAHARLQRLGIPAMEIAELGWDGGGCLLTPYKGLSLYNWVRHGGPRDPERRCVMYRALGEVTGRMLQCGIFHRDYKASNFVVDEASLRLWLIDAGTVRFSHRVSEPQARRMVELLWENLRDASTYHTHPAAVEPTAEDRQAFQQAVDEVWGRER